MRICVIILSGALFLAGCGEKPPTTEQLAGRAARAMFDHDYAEARRLIEQVVATEPDVPAYRITFAHAALRLEQNDVAKIQYEAALKLVEGSSATDPGAVDDQVMLLVCLNRQDEARRVIEEAAARFPDSPEVQLLAEDKDRTLESWEEWQLPDESANPAPGEAPEPADAPAP
jgi:predicted Zn-dependent protease